MFVHGTHPYPAQVLDIPCVLLHGKGYGDSTCLEELTSQEKLCR